MLNYKDLQFSRTQRAKLLRQHQREMLKQRLWAIDIILKYDLTNDEEYHAMLNALHGPTRIRDHRRARIQRKPNIGGVLRT